MQLLSRIPPQHQEASQRWCLTLALAAALLSAVQLLAYSEDTESTGALWWKVTRQVPDSERLPYLLSGVALATLAIILFAAGAWIFAHPAMRRQRHNHRKALEKERFQTQTPEGRAQRAFELGDAGFAAELRVDDGSHWPVLRRIEAEGWRQTGQRLHKLKRITHVTPHWDGGHTVERSSTQNATFSFARRSEDT